MKKNVLIPTDFTIESLNVVKSVLNNRPDGCRYNIVLLHGIRMSDSITDLLFFSKAKVLESLNSRSFEEACDVIKNKYASAVASIRTDIYTGNTRAAFNDYLIANRIDEVYIPGRYDLQLNSKKSIDILPYIKGCKRPVYEIEWNMEVMLPEKGKLAEIFYNEVTAS